MHCFPLSGGNFALKSCQAVLAFGVQGLSKTMPGMGTIFRAAAATLTQCGRSFQKSESWALWACSFCTDPGLLPVFQSRLQPLQSTNNSTPNLGLIESTKPALSGKFLLATKGDTGWRNLPSFLLPLDSYWKIHLLSLLFPPLGTLQHPPWPSLPT